jgi:pimeloyl-ACP methyl ester carboxylesterase
MLQLENTDSSAFPAREGFVSFRGYKVWYRTVGNDEEPGKLPLLVLHGGPGAAHDYLEPIEALARTGRRVIFYDQLGCGNSLLHISAAAHHAPNQVPRGAPMSKAASTPSNTAHIFNSS